MSRHPVSGPPDSARGGGTGGHLTATRTSAAVSPECPQDRPPPMGTSAAVSPACPQHRPPSSTHGREQLESGDHQRRCRAGVPKDMRMQDETGASCGPLAHALRALSPPRPVTPGQENAAMLGDDRATEGSQRRTSPTSYRLYVESKTRHK